MTVFVPFRPFPPGIRSGSDPFVGAHPTLPGFPPHRALQPAPPSFRSTLLPQRTAPYLRHRFHR